MYLTSDEKFELKGKALEWCYEHLDVPSLDKQARKEMRILKKSRYSWNGVRHANLMTLFRGDETDFLKSMGAFEVVDFSENDEDAVDLMFDYVLEEIEKYVESKSKMDGDFTIDVEDSGIYLNYSEEASEYM